MHAQGGGFCGGWITFLLTSTWIYLVTSQKGCLSPLGMEDGRIKDSQIRASSSRSGPSRPIYARFNHTEGDGGWCPDQKGLRNKTHRSQYIQVLLDEPVRIKGIAMQGSSSGLGKVERFFINYTPNKTGGPASWQWMGSPNKPYKSNVDSPVQRTILKYPLISDGIRLVPLFNVSKQVCMRFELLGCPLVNGLMYYNMTQGNFREGKYNFTDSIYDGIRENILSLGVGYLTDGILAPADYAVSNGLGWIGWHSRDTPAPYVMFEFLQTRIFDTVVIHCNVRDRENIRLFSKVKVSFSVTGSDSFHRSVTKSPKDVSSGSSWINYNVTVDLCRHTGKKIKLDFTYSGEWILISEITFKSEALGSQLPPEVSCVLDVITTLSIVPPSDKMTTFTTASPSKTEGAAPTIAPTITTTSSPLEIAFITTGATVALFAVVMGIIFFRKRQERNKRESKNVQLSLMEIPPERITFMELLGRGAFGNVHKSVMRESPETNTSSKLRHQSLDAYEGKIVATKVLREHANEEEKHQFLREIDLMKEIGDHRNVLKMLGYWIKNEPIMLIMEYVPNGDLLQWLRKRRQQLSTRKSRQKDVVERLKPPVPKLMSKELKMEDSREENVKEEKMKPKGDDNLKEKQEIEINHDVDEASFLINDVEPDEMDPLYSTIGDEDVKKLKDRKGNDVETITIVHFAHEKELPSVSKPLKMTELNISITEQEKDKSDCIEDEGEVFSAKDVLCYAWQIVRGMEYLVSKGFVHRDLAARNILLGEDRAVKIADFGLMRRTNESEIYEVSSVKKLPVKWTAPEALENGIFTYKTDVWSFGVVLWELATMGRSPYPEISDMRLCSVLKSGYRMEKPNTCSDEIYELMMGCWKEDPNERPSFSQLIPILEKMMTEDTPYCDFTQLDEKQAYYNNMYDIIK